MSGGNPGTAAASGRRSEVASGDRWPAGSPAGRRERSQRWTAKTPQPKPKPKRPRGPEPATTQDTTPLPRHWTHAEPTWHVHVATTVGIYLSLLSIRRPPRRGAFVKKHRPRTKRKGASPRRLPPDLSSNPPIDSHFRTTKAATSSRPSKPLLPPLTLEGCSVPFPREILREI